MENIGTYIIGIKNGWMEDVGGKPPKHWYYFLEPETNQFVMETNLPTLNLWQGLFQFTGG